MERPHIADLFCGAGGAAMGLHQAGFEVVGFDIEPQKHYPFEFHQQDAFSVDLSNFDAVWASPPCQAYISFNFTNNKKNGKPKWDSVPPTRHFLQASGKPFIIENIVTAPLRNWVRLCGSSFGLGVRRHRRFEASIMLLVPPCKHNGVPLIAVYGDHPQSPGDQATSKLRINRAKSLDEAKEAMGIDWMTWKELTQAIPPAYSEFLGKQLLKTLED